MKNYTEEQIKIARNMVDATHKWLVDAEKGEEVRGAFIFFKEKTCHPNPFLTIKKVREGFFDKFGCSVGDDWNLFTVTVITRLAYEVAELHI